MQRLIVPITLTLLLWADAGAQSPPKKPSRVKALAARMADTAVTSAASTAADTLLGSRGAAVASLVGGGQASTSSGCPQGLVMVSTATGGGTPAAAPSSGAAIVGVAKKKMFGKGVDSTPPAASPAASFTCVTAEQAEAMQGAQPGPSSPASSAAPSSVLSAVASGGAVGSGASSSAGASGAASVASGVGSMMGGKQGMLVGGAAAAAPLAGRGLKALGGMFGRGGPSREHIVRDLARGRLQLKSVRFIEGSDALKEGFENELALIAEALQSVEGAFFLVIPPESDGRTPPDTVMARRRLMKLATYLQVAGIPESRVSVASGLAASLESRPAKPGEARVEIVRLADGARS